MASNYQPATVPERWSYEEKRYARQVDELFERIYNRHERLLDRFYPVGSLFMHEKETFNPARTIGGKWDSIGYDTFAGRTFYMWIRRD